MSVDISGFPRVADPDITRRSGSKVPVFAKHVVRQVAFLFLVLVLRSPIR
jgi:hypothetical protein